MLRKTDVRAWRGIHLNPGRTRRGGKNVVWRPKYPNPDQFVRTDMQHPPRRPESWQPLEFDRLGNVAWPKEVGFYNAGDNFELSPEMRWRLFVKNCDETFWTPELNEQTIIEQFPLIEENPKQYMPRVQQVFAHHVKRYGPDHTVYNAAMQAHAFAKDFDGALKLYNEMPEMSLQRNTQSVVNMMLASMLCGKPKEKANEFFLAGVRAGIMTPVMRLDTEFEMWWSQLQRMGSFTAQEGYLSNKDEQAKSRPKDMWAIWGWDRSERKHLSRHERVQEEVKAKTVPSKIRYGCVATGMRREPWSRYKGMYPWDFRGPRRATLSRAAEAADDMFASSEAE